MNRQTIPRRLDILIPNDIRHYDQGMRSTNNASFLHRQGQNTKVSQKSKQLSESYEVQHGQGRPQVNSTYHSEILAQSPLSQNLFVSSGRNRNSPKINLANQFYTPSNKQKQFKLPKPSDYEYPLKDYTSSNQKDLELHQITPQRINRSLHRVPKSSYSDNEGLNKPPIHNRRGSDLETVVPTEPQIATKVYSVPKKSSHHDANPLFLNRLAPKHRGRPKQKNEETVSTDEEKSKGALEGLVTQVLNGQLPRAIQPRNDSLTKTIQVKQKPKQLSQQETPKRLKSPEYQAYQHSNYYMPKLREYIITKQQNSDPAQAQLFLDHVQQTFNSMHFVKMLRPIEMRLIKQKQSSLKPRLYKFPKTVVFDLDETLIHCNDGTGKTSDVYLPIVFPNGEIVEAGINIRPYAVYILSELSKFCEVVVFTASHSSYATKVLDHLDPKNQWISQRLFREHCVLTQEQVHIKDLRVLCADRSLKDIVLVDNAAYSFGYQIFNGIPIVPYYDNKNDKELLDLMEYLKYILRFEDVREINKQYFKMNVYQLSQSMDELVEKLFD